MFEKFGELNSAEEINRKAEELKGDIDKLKQFAAENGLEEDDVNDYVDGVITELATPLTAAMGKIKAEKEELELHGVLEDWQNSEKTNRSFTGQYMNKTKRQDIQ